MLLLRTEKPEGPDFQFEIKFDGYRALASISTVPERTNAASFWGDQANSMTSFLFPNHGIGVGVSASPEATRYGL